MLLSRRLLSSALLAALVAPHLSSATSGRLKVDASSPAPKPQDGLLHMGSDSAGVAPNGGTVHINNQSLVLNGDPWLPVSGEFHYSRYPASQWLSELRKMKASGVDIVSFYVIWIHHEEIQDDFEFSDNLDITRFVETAAEAGLSVVARLGPWVHAEVRNGGIPDWVMKQAGTVRSNDPIYMSFVETFWTEIADMIKGLLFKNGGPIIAIQLENEYKPNGEGQGAAHIAKLKSLAVSLGLDVPLYTCTAWENTYYPVDEIVPVYGGYQDKPWDTTLEDEPPNETYQFRYFAREAGSLTHDESNGNPNTSLVNYPFLTAEYGGGAASMYRRRVALNLPDDVAAVLPVQIGSGVNLLGYYMYHGGENPEGKKTTLQETHRDLSNSYNDLTIVNYDYQSPFGQYGYQGRSLKRLKLFHYWLREQGSKLARMSLRKPAVLPNGTDDLNSLRWSVRSDGKSGYLFVNNYVRQYEMPKHEEVQFQVGFSKETITVPSRPATIPSGAYFIWPLNLMLGAAKLKYASAQLITSLATSGRMTVFFFRSGDIPVEFAFDRRTVSRIRAASGTLQAHGAGHTLVHSIKPSHNVAVHLTDISGDEIDIVVLDQASADDLWHIKIDDKDVVVLTEQELEPTDHGFSLVAHGRAEFGFATYPRLNTRARDAASTISKTTDQGVFARYRASGMSKHQDLSVTARQLRKPKAAPPIEIGGDANGALVPSDRVVDKVSGLWTIHIPWSKLAHVKDGLLRIDYTGDLARLYAGDDLLNDHYYNGQTWSISLKHIKERAHGGDLTLAIMPLREDAPIYIQTNPEFDAMGQACAIDSISISTVYDMNVAVI